MFKRITLTMLVGLTILAACSGGDDGSAGSGSESVDSDAAPPGVPSTTRTSTAAATTAAAPATTTADPATTRTATTGATAATDGEVATTAPPVIRAQYPARSGPYAVCRPGPRKTITKLDPVTIDEVVIPGVTFDDHEVDGGIVEGFTIPDQVIPAQTIDTGCIVEYEAPAGCLGAVEISPVVIPAGGIPEVALPDATLAGEVIAEGRTASGEQVEQVRVSGRRVEQVCRQKPKPGAEIVSEVVRPEVVRPEAVRPEMIRNEIVRPERCEVDACVPPVALGPAAIGMVAVEAVAVGPAALEVRVLRGTDTTELEEPQRTTFIAPSDVLFDTDQATLEPEAIANLRTVVAEIRQAPPNAEITVEGHTDYRNSDADNQVLSERRARAVADWLDNNGGIDRGRITTKGYGESAPVAPNRHPNGTDNRAGMAKNRRVAISVTTG